MLKYSWSTSKVRKYNNIEYLNKNIGLKDALGEFISIYAYGDK
jgi:hypothetical protein